MTRWRIIAGAGSYKKEILRVKVTISEVNLINSLNSRLDKPVQIICELKDKSELISILKHTEAKRFKRKKQ